MFPTPDFIKVTQADILASFISDYEEAYFILTGETVKLHPAQAEQLLVNSGTHQVYLHALRIQSAALQNLAQFATYPQLDQICAPFGVTRLPAQAAQCTVQFTLNTGHGALVIPDTLRVGSQDGLSTFRLIAPIVVAVDVDVVSGVMVCDTVGLIGNNYVPGTVSMILDPQAYLTAAVNTDKTSGGSDVETDEALRGRLYLSSSAFSTAGAEDSYRYFAKTASPLILDVGVDNGGGGVVNLYPLVSGGITSPEILAAVEAACNPKNKRPTSDLVHAYSPTVINYTIDISVTGYSGSDYAGGMVTALAAVQAYVAENSKKLNLDIVRSQIAAAARNDAFYDVVINQPAANIVVNETQVAVCTGINMVLTGFNNDK